MKTMRFKSSDSGRHYSYLEFAIDSIPKNNRLPPWFKYSLRDQIEDIEYLFDTMEKKIPIDLQIVFVDYPQLYKDVFNNYMKVFEQSKNWGKYLRDYKPKGHIEVPFDNILMEGMFYQPFDSLLKVHKYMIIGYYTEHCILNSTAELKEAGFNSNTPIPTCIEFGMEVSRIKN